MFKKKKFKWDQGKPSELFDLEECLGEGTYGIVWTGVEKKTNQTCAVKIVGIDDDLEEIQQEIDIMRDSDSPYIVKFYGCYWGDKSSLMSSIQTEEQIWMIMEHCVAGSVNDLMYVCDITFNKNQIVSCISGIALGLAYLHDHFVIHRDIKAGNVLLTHDGFIRLADFGVSARLRNAKDRTTTAIGAPFWMAPEVILEERYDCRADVWSMGITLIELAESRPPNSSIHPMEALVQIPKMPVPKLQDQRKWPDSMHKFIKACLNKNMNKRPTAKKMLEHPLIADEVKKIEKKKGKSVVMEKLVQKCLQQIQAARKDDASEYDYDPNGENESVYSSVLESDDDDEEDVDTVLVNEGASAAASTSKRPVSELPPGLRVSAKPHQSMHLNPLKDYRQSARYQAPLRDVFNPDEGGNIMGKKDVTEDDIAEMMNRDDNKYMMAGVMNKNFIKMVKQIHEANPAAFGNKRPASWKMQDITTGISTHLVSMLASNDDNDDYFQKPGNFDVDDFIETLDNDDILNEVEDDDDDEPPPFPISKQSIDFADIDAQI